MKLLAKAIRIASEAFEDKLDKGGNPYILHCLYVMNGVKHLGEEAMICGVLHDLIEDTDWTLDDLIDKGFASPLILNTLYKLTHEKSVEYMDYIKQISFSPVATAIKLVDLEHNSNITRMKGLTKKDFDRLEKYHIAYEYLRKC